MNPWRIVVAGGAIAGGALVALECGGKDSTSPTPVPVVARVVITSPSAAPTLATLGRTVQFAAQALDSSGAVMSGQTITWSSSQGAVAAIDPASGLATAAANGATTIRAAVGSVAATMTLTVSQVVAQVVVSPASFGMGAKGSTRQLTATVKDSGGSAIAGASATWATSNAAAVTVSASGLATAVSNGLAQLTATASGVAGAAQATVAIVVAQLVVTPGSATFGAAGRTRQFSAAASDSNGNPVAGASAAWFSTNASVVTVDNSGLATSVANGTAQVRAVTGSDTAAAGVTVDIAVASLALTPGSTTLTLINQTQAIGVTALDSGGSAIANPHLTWISRAPAAVAVDTVGTVRAIQEGSGYVVATASSGAADSVAVAVSVYHASIAVSPGAVTLTALGATQQLTAAVKDSNGTTVPNAVTGFGATAHGAATVGASSGLVTAQAVGADTVTVTSGPASAMIPVTVRQDVATISVTPGTATLFAQGRTLQFGAGAKDANANPIPGTVFTWASTNTTVATVDASTGLATASTDGTAQIQASAGGRTGSGTLTVSRVVASVTVQSANLRNLDTLTTLGAKLSYSGTATDSNGATIAGKSFSWLSRRTATATVSPGSGSSTQATSVANGTAIIVGTAGAKSDSATLVVNAALPTSASVSVGDLFFKSVANGSEPAVDTIAAGGTVTWNWVGGTGIQHSVQSTGTPSFTGSAIQSSGSYAFTFTAAGTYTYQCGVHGALMHGTVVVK